MGLHRGATMRIEGEAAADLGRREQIASAELHAELSKLPPQKACGSRNRDFHYFPHCSGSRCTATFCSSANKVESKWNTDRRVEALGLPMEGKPQFD
jgi:hypothetical protein